MYQYDGTCKGELTLTFQKKSINVCLSIRIELAMSTINIMAAMLNVYLT